MSETKKMEAQDKKPGILEIYEVTIWNSDFKDGIVDSRRVVTSIQNGFLEVIQEAKNFIRLRGMSWVLQEIYEF